MKNSTNPSTGILLMCVGFFQPVHQLLLVAMGVPIFDNCDLEALGREAERQGRWEFLLTAAPLPVPGGTGSPLNPIATF